MKTASSNARAFTLLEIMVVVAILGIALMIGIPSIREATHREALPQALRDVTEACARARARAIMSSAPTELHIFPHERRIQIADAPVEQAKQVNTDPEAGPILGRPFADSPVPRRPDQFPGFSATLSDRLTILLLDVNFVEYKDEDEAVIRFHPNGTCDQMILILQSDTGEKRKITLEVVTGLAEAVAL
jgi:prepilin-type N-terminal cleavage/methylation domain-containing protein